MRLFGPQGFACSLVLLSSVVRAQTVPETKPQMPQATTLDSPSAKELLQQTALLYARPGLLHVEAIEETHQENELMEQRRKILRTFEQSTGNRWRVETRASDGSWVDVSDGKTEWKYWVEAKAYEQHPAGVAPTQYRAYFGGDEELRNAVDVAINLESMATKVVKPERLPDETIALSGQIECYVVRAESSAGDKEAKFVSTMWIDKKTHLIRKVFEDNHTYLIDGDVHVPFHETRVLTFPIMDLDAHVPDTAFVFTPPAGTRQRDTLEPQWARQAPDASTAGAAKPSFVVKPDVVANAPLVDNEGKVTTLNAYRGKLVLVDLWATWCGPCIASMPAFSAIIDSLKGSDLTVLSVDEDEKRDTASSYMDLHGYTWTNLHDRRSGLQKALGIDGIPRTVLLDRDGKVLFSESVAEEGTGYETKLRAALNKAMATHP